MLPDSSFECGWVYGSCGIVRDCCPGLFAWANYCKRAAICELLFTDMNVWGVLLGLCVDVLCWLKVN